MSVLRRAGRGESGAKRTKGRRARPGVGRAGRLFEDLVALQAHLLSPHGCPWDREQTHESLRTYLVEETYEVLEALESGVNAHLAAELGDLLLQIVFHAQLAKQAGRFDIGDVIQHIHSKMVRRHPHVFGDAKAKTAGQVLKNWEQLKAEERRAAHGAEAAEAGGAAGIRGAQSLLDGLPKTLPALLEAYQLTRRASRVGFDWEDIEGLLMKLREEAGELRAALRHPDRGRLEEEVGDLLFVAVNVARFLRVDPEIALKDANRKFKARFREMERQAARQGQGLADVSRDELEALWEATKVKKPTGAAPAARIPATGKRN